MFKKCNKVSYKFLAVILFGTMLISCSGDKTAGTDEQSEGITAIKNLDIAGVSQKGPFAKGSAVTVQGVDCKTLKFTDEVFEGKVKSDKGDFAVDDITLSSTCAVFEVTGNYFNEVTGKKTKDKLTLHALTNLKDRKNVNINMLTELEYERMMNLAIGKETSFAEAKTQAEKEVLAAFGFNGGAADKVQEFENLNIFEKGEGNAALLAVSVLMQGDADAASLAKRLEKFADDFAEDGEWNDSKTKTEIAEWATTAKENGKLDTIRKNVETMNDGDKVAAFETYVSVVANVIPDSVPGSASSSSKKISSSSSVDLILSSGDSRISSSLQNDRISSSMKNASSSSSKNVILSSSEGFSDSKSSSSMKNTSSSSWSGAIGSSNDSRTAYLNPNVNYGEMTDSRDGQVYKTVKIGNQVWMAQNLNYADSVKTPSLKGKSWCYNDSTEYCEKYGRLYMWAAAIDSVKLATDKDNPVDCGNGKLCGLIGPLQGVCPDGWHLPSYGEWNALFTEVGGLSVARNVLKSLSGWNNNNNGSDAFGFSAFPVGFWSGKGGFTNAGYSASFWSSMEESKFNAYDVDIGFLSDNVDLVSGKNYGFSIRCLKGEVSSVAIRSSSSVASSSSNSALWTEVQSSSSFVFDLSVPKESYLNPDVQYGSLVDSRDNQIYKTVQIGDQVWMAQNLNYASEGSSCFNDTAAYCELFGRLYYWSAAMDSVGTWSDNGKGCGFKKSCTPTYPVRGVCPEGWHLPSAEEFETLVATIGGLDSASIKLMSPLGWYDHFMTRQFNPNNSTGFSAIAAGGKSTESGYWGIGRGAGFFSSTDYNTYNARNMSLYPGEPAVGTNSKNGMESVRCVKD